jgi:hypothetical protein
MKARQKNNSKRKYYKSASNKDGEVISSPLYKMFLVRFHNKEDGTVQTEGPFPEKEKADQILNSYLKRGICSWLVSYNE